MDKQCNDSFRQNRDALAICRGGKPTEGVLLRFNEQEFYLLNLASHLAASRGYSSRQAWMRHTVLNAIRDELEDTSDMQALVDEFIPAP